MKQHTYIAIDLKSFYASVECRERGLDPLDTNLVVADESRTDKTICLAVTPSLKSYGISGRGRLFEVKQRVKEANAGRSTTRQDTDWTAHHTSTLNCKQTCLWRLTSSSRRPGWRITWSTAPASIRFISSILPRKILCLLHRRGVHGRDGLPEYLQALGT